MRKRRAKYNANTNFILASDIGLKDKIKIGLICTAYLPVAALVCVYVAADAIKNRKNPVKAVKCLKYGIGFPG